MTDTALDGEVHHYVMMEVGSNFMELPDGFHPHTVALVGMRDREYPPMDKRDLKEVKGQLAYLRAVPTMWAPDYVDKLIYCWPWASTTFKVHLTGRATKKALKE